MHQICNAKSYIFKSLLCVTKLAIGFKHTVVNRLWEAYIYQQCDMTVIYSRLLLATVQNYRIKLLENTLTQSEHSTSK